MKKILITGANSYVGTSFETYLKTNYPDQYTVDTVDMLDGSWRTRSFAGYDAVFHVAGIAHRKETAENRSLYFSVNRDLAVETAQKAKKDGVGQFIFMSTMSVYGKETGIITPQTVPKPKNAYGKSKLEAERLIRDLASPGFSVCILRPPMIYGPDCRGNFQTVIRLVRKSPVFPKVSNQRSFLFVDHLSLFVKSVIDLRLSGLFFPQDASYMNTTQMALWIAEKMGKKIRPLRIAGVGVACLRPFSSIVRKAFGSLVYADVDPVDFEYCPVPLEQAVKSSVQQGERF